MRMILICMAIGLTLAGPSMAGREVCWSEPPDLNGLLVSSWGTEPPTVYAEVANDFILAGDRIIRKARWWGGYYNPDVPCDPGAGPLGFYLAFYLEADCLPNPPSHQYPYAEYLVEGAAGETFIDCQFDFYPLYRYEADLNFVAMAGVRYFFGAQMILKQLELPFWGRLATGSVTGCECAVFTNAYIEDWCLPISDFYGFSLDVSQEFECDVPVPVERTSWGRIRALYR